MTKLSAPQRIALLGYATMDRGPALLRVRRPGYRPYVQATTYQSLVRKGLVQNRLVSFRAHGTAVKMHRQVPTTEGYAALDG